ncbi:stromelysin-1-like [Mercenaria mercenaria]|uniref:stromelysin-1-like n=1 Tax=Mercenaria mercenaria TaxID=6596 RepID=UPI00234F31EA|nr:stromelysin-1-like [Mercenaria mercenaria]
MDVIVYIYVGLLAGFLPSALSKNYDCELPSKNCPAKTQEYLEFYGYLDPEKPCIREDIVAALTKFQELNIDFMGLNVTGECDNITVLVMNQPRCGCEDIVKFDMKKMMPQNFIGPQEFRLGNTKWRKKELTWSVLKYPRNPQTTSKMSNSDVDDAMRRALDIWAKVTTLSFRQLTNDRNADITIKFEVRRHTSTGPYYDFDGPGNVLAHAFFPESGIVHFDDDEHFVLNNNEGTELFIVAAHEFGHTLGISHSNIKDALMAPYYRYSKSLQLHTDDIGAVQTLYGPSDKNRPATTSRPTNPPTPRPTPKPTVPHTVPAYCNMQIKASFSINQNTYVFTRENVGYMRTKTFVYKVTRDGLQPTSRKPIEDMFIKTGSRRYPRAHPYRVDAAAYIPHKRYIFLFSGTRAYRYSIRREDYRSEGPFVLDERQGFPKWMDVTEFPERPRAAVAMPYSNYNSYYMLIFGTTMVWDWNFYSERVGAWAYPIDVFGRNMPQRVDGAYLENDKRNVIFFKNHKFYKFEVRRRRVVDTNVMDVKRDFFKGRCA